MKKACYIFAAFLLCFLLFSCGKKASPNYVTNPPTNDTLTVDSLVKDTGIVKVLNTKKNKTYLRIVFSNKDSVDFIADRNIYMDWDTSSRRQECEVWSPKYIYRYKDGNFLVLLHYAPDGTDVIDSYVGAYDKKGKYLYHVLHEFTVPKDFDVTVSSDEKYFLCGLGIMGRNGDTIYTFPESWIVHARWLDSTTILSLYDLIDSVGGPPNYEYYYDSLSKNCLITDLDGNIQQSFRINSYVSELSTQACMDEDEDQLCFLQTEPAKILLISKKPPYKGKYINTIKFLNSPLSEFSKKYTIYNFDGLNYIYFDEAGKLLGIYVEAY